LFYILLFIRVKLNHSSNDNSFFSRLESYLEEEKKEQKIESGRLATMVNNIINMPFVLTFSLTILFFVSYKTGEIAPTVFRPLYQVKGFTATPAHNILAVVTKYGDNLICVETDSTGLLLGRVRLLSVETMGRQTDISITPLRRLYPHKFQAPIENRNDNTTTTTTN
jgi:hypothetical protein